MKEMTPEEKIEKYKEEARKRYEDLKNSSRWYQCPKCGNAWARVYNGYSFDPPKNAKISGKKLCVNCKEITIDGKKFAPMERSSIEKGVNIYDFRCPICKGRDFEIQSGEGLVDVWTCKYCGCRSNVDFDSMTGDIHDITFREDVTRKGFREALEKMIELSKTKPILIKNGEGREEE